MLYSVVTINYVANRFSLIRKWTHARPDVRCLFAAIWRFEYDGIFSILVEYNIQSEKSPNAKKVDETLIIP